MLKGRRQYKQLRDLLFGAKSHELLVFCFFLAVSFGFWLLQALNEMMDHEVQVRTELENVPSDIVIIDSLPATVAVTLRDRGLILVRHNIANLFRPNRMKLDFSKYETGRNDAEVSILPADVQRLLRRNLAPSVRILSVRPDTLRFAYNHGLSRTLPVKLVGSFKAQPQNYIQSIRVEPDSVRVFAPKAVLDTMRAVCSETFLHEGLQQNSSFQVGLHKQKLVKCEPGQVNVRVGVGYYTEKTVRVHIVGLNFPAEKKLRTFPAQATVTFRVESGRYNQLTEDDFVLATTYEELLTDTVDSKLHLHLKTVPEGVSDVRISPSEVDFLIEQVDGQN